MLERLLYLYPNAITAKVPNSDPQFIWFKENNNNQYLGIPNIDLSQKEIDILHILFPIFNVEESAIFSKTVRIWREFLLYDGPIPPAQKENCRFIHFSLANIKEEFQLNEWEEALKSLFPDEVIFIPLSEHEGIIIEDQKDIFLLEDDLFSAIQTFESDFFFKVHFYIGRFQAPNNKLRQLFDLEQSMFQLSHTYQPEERIFTLEKLIPSYIYHIIPVKDRNMMFADVHHLLIEDRELSATIKRYIENQSNATLTAKELFMHRNSLQYRIDKFIEKTGIDIKTFHGAFFAYLACLHMDEE